MNRGNSNDMEMNLNNSFISFQNTPCIGILAETKNVWERRVSLSPTDCKILIEKGIKIIVQPSMIRCFSDNEYQEIGAIVSDDLSECNLILGIKKPREQSLLPNKTYMCFSHTRKGRTDHPNFLEKILEKNIRFIDYDCIKDSSSNNAETNCLVSFSKISGIAGTINILKGIGELLLSRNISTPFIFTKLAHMYSSEKDALESVVTLGKYIQEQYLPEDLVSFTIAVLGDGKVSSGVLETLERLPNKKITPLELLQGSLEKRRDLIYIVELKPEDIYIKKDFVSNHKNSGMDTQSTNSFRKQDLQENPEKYLCNFNEKYLKYFHLIINCLYWENSYPKIITKDSLRKHIIEDDSKLLAISDISCDLNGAIEILSEYSSYRKPFFIYEPISKKIIYDIDKATKEGIIYHAIPHLASSFPEDASQYFSNSLLPYVEKIATSKYPQKYEDQTDIPLEISRAIVTSNGVLTSKYRNIFRNSEERSRIIQTELKEQTEKPYFASFKLKGHLFDSGFFHELINVFPKYDVAHKTNYLKIGENCDFSSVFYFDVFASNKDNIKAFQSYLEAKKTEYEYEEDLMKTNIY